MIAALLILLGLLLGVALTQVTRANLHLSTAGNVWRVVLDGITLTIGMLNALAVIFLGLQANKLAASTRRKQEEHDAREAAILLSYVVPELREAKSHLEVIKHLMHENDHKSWFCSSQDVRAQVADELAAIALPLTNSVLPRMHVMPAGAGSALAQLLGIVSTTKNASRACTDRSTLGATQNMLGELVEPESATQEALEMFEPAYRMIKSGVKLAVSDIERLVESERIMREATL